MVVAVTRAAAGAKAVVVDAQVAAVVVTKAAVVAGTKAAAVAGTKAAATRAVVGITITNDPG